MRTAEYLVGLQLAPSSVEVENRRPQLPAAVPNLDAGDKAACARNPLLLYLYHTVPVKFSPYGSMG